LNVLYKVHVYRTATLRRGVVKFVDTILYVKCLCLIRKWHFLPWVGRYVRFWATLYTAWCDTLVGM